MRKCIRSREWKKFCGLLRQTRLAAGLSQARLAQLLKKPQSFVSRYETGERRLDVLETKAICDALGVSVSQLFVRFEEQRS